MSTDQTIPPHPEGAWPAPAAGEVWLVGAGPGDPGLLTLHALNALRGADAVVHDALVSDDILALAPPEAERISAGKRGGRPSAKQADITSTLVRLAREGRRIVRLKGGDPFIFGRGGEEAEGLQSAGVPFRIVPGITAGVAGLAFAGVPATHRDVNQALTFVTGHDQHGRAPSVDWAAIARGGQVVVIYMGMRHLEEIAAEMIAAGRKADEPVLIVREATTPRQLILETTLAAAAADAARAGIDAPAIICVGPVRRLAGEVAPGR